MRDAEKLGMDRIKVLHCIHSLSGGGAEKQLRLLVDQSAAHGMDAAIFCVRDEGRNDIQDVSVPIYRSRRQNKYNFSIFASLNFAINNFKPEILHAWLPASVTIPAMSVAMIKAIPCVYAYRRVMSFTRPLTGLEFATAVLSTSRIVSNNFIDSSNLAYRLLYKIKSGVQIPNAVSIDGKWLKEMNQESADAAWSVLFVGRITREKNWPCLLRAISLVEPGHQVRLTICGDGDQTERMLAMARDLNIDRKITYLGYRQDVYRIMQSSDMLVLPSWREGMPNVLLEALNIGLPCAISDIPAHRRLIGTTKAALMFDPANPQELARQIDLLSSSPGIGRQLAERGRRVAQEFTPERLARAYHEMYSSLINPRAAVTSVDVHKLPE